MKKPHDTRANSCLRPRSRAVFSQIKSAKSGTTVHDSIYMLPIEAPGNEDIPSVTICSSDEHQLTGAQIQPDGNDKKNKMTTIIPPPIIRGSKAEAIRFAKRKYTGNEWKYMAEINPVPRIALNDTVRYDIAIYGKRRRGDTGFNLSAKTMIEATEANES